MSFDDLKNFAVSAVASPPSPADTGTTLDVLSGQGALFPTPPFNVVISPAGAEPTTATAEIARVSDITGDTLTISRAEEGSTARSVITGDRIDQAVTKKTITDIQAASFPIGSSYLSATSVLGAGQAGNSSLQVPWTQVDLDGSDLAINGDNAYLIDVLTDGWYVTAANFSQVFVDDFGDTFIAGTCVQLTTDGGAGSFSPYWQQDADLGQGSFGLTLTTPPVFIAAGKQIEVDLPVYITGGGANTWKANTPLFLDVVRLS